MSDGRILPDCMIGPNDPCKGYVELNDRVVDLEQQLAEALKDAERYQWLRGTPLLRHECFSYDGLSLKQDRELDEAIDAAIGRKEGE